MDVGAEACNFGNSGVSGVFCTLDAKNLSTLAGSPLGTLTLPCTVEGAKVPQRDSCFQAKGNIAAPVLMCLIPPVEPV